MEMYAADLDYVKRITEIRELREAEKLYKEELAILMKKGLLADTDKVKNRLYLIKVQQVLTTIKQRFKHWR